MLQPLAAVGIALVPFIAVVALLVVAERVQRRRGRVTARQVSLTEAIHQELGAVVAPTVEKPAWGPWRVVIPVRFEDPGFASRVLAIAHRALAGSAAPFQIVLVPQAAARRRH
jgi:hypothetical protein